MINEQIRDKEVRLIGADGAQLGIMSAKEAMFKAQEAGLDLVKIAPQAKPPVRTMEPGASCQIIILKKGLKNYDENITDSHTGKLYFCQLSDRAKSCTGVHGKA